MRSHIGLWLQSYDQALDLIAMAGVMQKMNSLSFALRGVARHLSDRFVVDGMKFFGVTHLGLAVSDHTDRRWRW